MLTCTVHGCCAIPRHGHIMCKRHWAMVPHRLQKAVWSAWRACIRTRHNELALREYDAAVTAATDAVNAIENPLQ